MLRRFAILLVLPAVLASFGGCGGSGNPGKETSNDSAAKAGQSADDLEGLKKLSEADRKLAEEQKFCPVSGGLLGSMGEPHKVTVKGRTFFLCCPQCEGDLNQDPDKYLKKLDDLLAKK